MKLTTICEITVPYLPGCILCKGGKHKSIMDVVLKTVNFILLRGLNHRQFRQLLLKAKNQYGDLLYFCKVRHLSVEVTYYKEYTG